MEIRQKLTYQFTGIVAVILLISSISIYLSFSEGRREEFFHRLESKTKLIAQMLMEIEGINTELLSKIEKNNPLSLPSEEIYIFDYLNNLIYSSDEDDIFVFSNEMINKVRLENSVRFKQDDYEILGAFYTGEYDRIVVFAAAIDIFGYSKLNRLRLILLIVFITSLIIIYFAGKVFAARALMPVSNIINQVNNISDANLHERINEGTELDELGKLSNTFNGMLDRLEAAFKTQKNFIANASHELRTPLTIITGHLEVSLMNDRPAPEYKQSIEAALYDIKNLNALANRLLLLARASSDFSPDSFSIIRIDDSLWEARSEILKRIKNSEIHILLSNKIEDERVFRVSGNEILIKTAIINIIENSCKYSSNKTCSIAVDADNDFLYLRFKDNGIGIPNDELNLIFEPFYRAKNSIGIKGHGLGLSIVDKIIKQHKGTVIVTSEENIGSEFVIQLPYQK
ncbi:MAG: HAMP domain-containing histidine kinase [Bacteroidetes bacterium]|nr:HAMP domain-containing histidine kinase [Bacteroidota bacterium]